MSVHLDSPNKLNPRFAPFALCLFVLAAIAAVTAAVKGNRDAQLVVALAIVMVPIYARDVRRSK